MIKSILPSKNLFKYSKYYKIQKNHSVVLRIDSKQKQGDMSLQGPRKEITVSWITVETIRTNGSG